MDLNFDLNLSNLGAQPDFYEVMAKVTAHPKIQLHLGTGRANIEKTQAVLSHLSYHKN